jgi:hypothetical protein
MRQSMLNAFADYEHAHALPDHHNIMQQYPGTRLYRVVRIPDGWRIWLATRDFIHGSFLELHNSGLVIRYDIRPDDGEESFVCRPSDDDIMRTATRSGALHSLPDANEGSTNTTRLVLDKDNEDNT